MADTKNYKAFGQDIQQRLTDLETKADESLTKTAAQSLYLGKTDTAASASKLTTSAGSATNPVYFSNGVPVSTTYTIASSVPADAKFTDTWRGIQDNLTSDSAVDSLSAKQGKALKSSFDTLSSDTKGYIKSVSVNGTTITFTKGDNTTSSITTKDSTYNTFTGATSSVAGTTGLVPAPTSGKTSQVLFSDGKWGDIAATTDITGNAGTATKLQTARTIGITGDVTATAVAFDGSQNISLATTFGNVGTAGTYGSTTAQTLTAGGTFTIPYVTTDAKGRVTAAGTRTMTMPAVQTTVSGNAGTATKLATARTIGISGAVTGTATSFDGSTNITIAATSVDGTKVSGIVPKATADASGNTIASTYAKKTDVYTKSEVDSKVSGIYSYKGTVDSYDDLPTTGVKTGDVYNIGTALDGKNYAAIVDSEGIISWDDIGGKVDLSSYVTKTTADSTYLSKSANAASASKLSTARTIALTGDATGSASFNGSVDASIETTLVDSGVIADSYGQSANSTATFGGIFKVPYVTFDAKGRATAASTITVTMPATPTSVSGNAGTATKLATARTINGISFDGTANIINYGTCSTDAATIDKVVSCTGFTLVAGAKIAVKFSVTNTVTPTANAPLTLNVNGTGAKSIFYRGSAVFSASYLKANQITEFIYDGTQYVVVGCFDSNTTYVKGTYNKLGLIKPSKSYTGAATLTTAAASATTAPTISAITTTSGRYYAVEQDVNGVPFVNVPWTNTNTDVNVTQTVKTDNVNYPILAKATSDTTTVTGTTSFASAVTVNPSTGTINATKFNGSVDGGNLTGTIDGGTL